MATFSNYYHLRCEEVTVVCQCYRLGEPTQSRLVHLDHRKVLHNDNEVYCVESRK